MSEKKSETFDYTKMTGNEQFVITTAQTAMPMDESRSFFNDLAKRGGTMEIVFTVNGFVMPFSAVTKALDDHFARAVNDAAGRLIVGKAQDLLDQVSDLGETLRSVKREVESKADNLFPGSVYKEDR